MTIVVSPVANSQTFGSWLSTTNRLANLMSQNTVTADSSNGGSVTTGNSYVNGHFGAEFVYVANTLVGGNISTNGTLTIAPNTVFSNGTSNLILITANSAQTSFIVNVNSINISGNTISINGNVSVNNSITVGNSSVNTVINSTSIAISNSSVAYSLVSPNTSQVAANSFFLNANGQWAQAVTSPSGSNTQIQFNDSGSFGASVALTFDKVSNTFTVNGDIRVTGALKDNSNRTLVVKDSTNTIVWGS